MLGKQNEPARLAKQESFDVPLRVVIAGSLVFGGFFTILGIVFYHYGVFL